MIVYLLELAAQHGVKAVLADRLNILLATDTLPDLEQLRRGQYNARISWFKHRLQPTTTPCSIPEVSA